MIAQVVGNAYISARMDASNLSTLARADSSMW